MKHSAQHINNEVTLSWDQIHRDSVILSNKIKESGIEFDGIVAITKGGLFPSAIISRELNINYIDTFCINSYKNKTHNNPNIFKLCNNDENKRLLFIDDLTDTGITISLIKRTFSFNKDNKFSVLYTKPSGHDEADFYVSKFKQNTWIVFPWEIKWSEC